MGAYPLVLAARPEYDSSVHLPGIGGLGKESRASARLSLVSHYNLIR